MCSLNDLLEPNRGLGSSIAATYEEPGSHFVLV